MHDRWKRNGLFILRSLAFVLVFAMLASYTLYVLTPKDDFGAGTMFRFYTQPQDTIDVLALGTSVTYSGLNTNVLWANWGISAYNLASAEQSYWNTYYYLKEALKTQKPRLILLDGKACVYPYNESPRGRTIVGTYGILSPENRFGAMKASSDEWFSHVLGYPQIHENWKNVRLEDFLIPAWMEGRSADWKGYVESVETEAHIKPSMVWSSIRKPIAERQQEYVEKILELAAAEGIPVLLIAYPNPGYEDEHLYYNSLWSLADEYGVPHLNLNDPEGHYRFRYTTQFSDWQHVNVAGSLKVSTIIGQYLKENYDLPDHRGDERYASWQRCMEEWQQAWPEYAAQLVTED